MYIIGYTYLKKVTWQGLNQKDLVKERIDSDVKL